MIRLLINTIIPLLLPLALLRLSLIINIRSYADREKISPFECGFDPKSNARIPFSLRFFLLAVLFLVFDIEIVLLLGSPIIFNAFSMPIIFYPFILFLIILIFGLIHEWNEGSLEWTN